MAEITSDDVRELLSRYAWAYDSNDRDEMAAVFAKQAEYDISLSDGTNYATLSGREAIFDFMVETRDSQLDQRRHVITNVRTLARDGDKVSIRAYLLLLSAGASLDDSFEALGTGVYDLDLIQEDGELRFARFVLVLDRPF